MELVTNSHPAKMDLLYTVFFIDVCSIFVFPVTYFRTLLNEKTNSRWLWIWPWEESRPMQVTKARFFHFAFLLKSPRFFHDWKSMWYHMKCGCLAQDALTSRIFSHSPELSPSTFPLYQRAAFIPSLSRSSENSPLQLVNVPSN